jgi:hypothetical protein
MAGYDPKRPRPTAAPDLDALIGSEAQAGDSPSAAPTPDATPVEIDESISADPVPAAARRVLPRTAAPLDRRVPPLAVLGSTAAAAVTFWLWRRWRR